MSQAALVIHSFSYPFIKNAARFIHSALRDYFDVDTPMLICDSVDDAQHDENTTVFLIGENFPQFRRRLGCQYVYLNFSVVTVLGRPWETGVKARRAIHKKWKMMAKHLPLIDTVLDYYPPQTKILQSKLKQPVMGFAVASPVKRHYTPMKARKFDVCFVGDLNERRKLVCEAIESMGMSLSPKLDIVIEDAVAQSRVCLNVHSFKSHHFEIPRFAAALSAGTPIATEPSFGSEAIVDQQYLFEESCQQLPAMIDKLLSQPDRLEDLGHNAHTWYANTYVPNAQDIWQKTCARLQSMSEARST